jgi:hypothetical protein
VREGEDPTGSPSARLGTQTAGMTIRSGLPRPVLIGLVFGVILLGLASMINAVDDWRDSRSAEDERSAQSTRIIQLNAILDCRFDVTQEVEDARAQVEAVALGKLDALALGLSAVTREDEAAVAAQAERIESLIVMGQEAQGQLDQALQVRAEAVQDCQAAATEEDP